MLTSRDSAFTITLGHTILIIKHQTYLLPSVLSKTSSTSEIRAISILLADPQMEKFGTPLRPSAEQRNHSCTLSLGREKSSI